MEYLFIYGTLKETKVQKSVIGRIVKSEKDLLSDYYIASIKLENKIYPIIKYKKGESVKGLLIEVSKEELKSIDLYETEAYKREKVTLNSKRKVWVYKK